MTNYQAQSTVGWLDYNDEAARKMNETLRALDEPSTLDPLGLGSIRDAFSDLIAPGTSTIHTRLRYFLFIAWICQRIEKSDTKATQFASRLRNDEATLIECLKAGGEELGVQGYSSGKNLKRMPSSAYWGGLRIWKIRNRDWSIADYGRNITRLRASTKADGADETIDNSLTTIWNDMPKAPENFLEGGVEFKLTSEEAQFIIQRIRESNPKSLLAFLCSNPGLAKGKKFPWEINQDSLPAELKKLLLDARNISELTLGPQLVYNLLVARRAGAELGRDVADDVAYQLEGLNNWADLIAARQDELIEWGKNLGALWIGFRENADTPKRASDIPKPASDFVAKMIHLALENPHKFAEDPRVHQEVRLRESGLKQNRSRFKNPEALKEWNSPGFGGQLSYRWRIAESYLSDIAIALESGN
jgi:hypothetical protein